MRKLTLRKETVRNLTDDKLDRVVGGSYTTATDAYCTTGPGVTCTSCGIPCWSYDCWPPHRVLE